jgi:4'-phosphopantetheinyl transferase EntD
MNDFVEWDSRRREGDHFLPAVGRLVEGMFESPVVVAAAAPNLYDPPPLCAIEQSAVERAVTKRVREFAWGRGCARAALERLGEGKPGVPQGKNREPLWPRGVAGSITHCDGLCAAAVARRTTVHSIGLDAEPHRLLPERVLHYITSADERAALAQLPQAFRYWPIVLFSAKESVFKCWFPITGKPLRFDDVRIRIVPHFPERTHGRLRVVFRNGAKAVIWRRPALEGHFLILSRHIITTMESAFGSPNTHLR